MSTTVISPEGTVYKWYQDNDWKPADLIEDATQALQQGNQRNAGPHTLQHPHGLSQVLQISLRLCVSAVNCFASI